MEENTDNKRKATPSIPANYISIIQLRERWINEKERKLKEEEDLKKAQVKGKREDFDGGLGLSNRKQNSSKDESINGGEAKFAAKDVPEVTVVHRDEGVPVKKKRFRKRYNSKKKKNQDVAVEEDFASCEITVTENKFINGGEAKFADKDEPEVTAVHRDEGLSEKKRRFRKRHSSKKKKNEDVAVEEDFVNCENIVTKNKTINGGEDKFAAKDVPEVAVVHRDEGLSEKKRRFRKRNNNKKNHDVAVENDVVDCEIIMTENNTPVKDAKESVGSREKGIETQIENLSDLKAKTRSRNRNYQPVRMQMGTGTMVWVKKRQNERDDDGIGSSKFA